MDKNYWENIFENYDTAIFDVLKNDKKGIIKTWIHEIASTKKTIADVGCGIGKWLPFLSKEFKKVLAIDFSIANLKFDESKYRYLDNIDYLNIDMTKVSGKKLNADAVLCVNAILNEFYPKRDTFFKNLAAFLKTNGHLILVVPSLESVLFTQYTMDMCNRRNGIKSKSGSKRSTKNEFAKFKKGVVTIEKTPTKHYLKEELISSLERYGFKIEKIDKVEYSWNSEMEHPPKSLKDPYPWDWLVKARKK